VNLIVVPILTGKSRAKVIRILRDDGLSWIEKHGVDCSPRAGFGLSHSGAFATISDKTPRNSSRQTCLQTVQIRNCFVVFVCWMNSSDEETSGILGFQVCGDLVSRDLGSSLSRDKGGSQIYISDWWRYDKSQCFSRAACNLHCL